MHNALGVGNAGGVRSCVGTGGETKRLVVMTSAPSARQAKENPYHDRIEGDILVYTGAGREGDQTLAGVNKRIPQQLSIPFPIYGFIILSSRRDRSSGPSDGNSWDCSNTYGTTKRHKLILAASLERLGF